MTFKKNMPPLSEDLDLHLRLLTCLNKFPNLRSQMPPAWPSDPQLNITVAQMKLFMRKRKGHWVINLPLALHNIEVNQNPRVTKLFFSIISKLDSFCADFISRGIPKAQKFIDPIWTDNWNLRDSRMFAIVAEVYFTYFLTSIGFVVKEFEKPYNALINNKSADILFDFKGTDTYVDIKTPKTLRWYFFKSTLRKDIVNTALKNMNEEFQNLPPNAYGVIAHLYRPLDRTGRWFKYKNDALDIVKHPTDLNKFSHIYWIKPVHHISGRELQLFDNTMNFSFQLLKPFWKRWWLIFLSTIGKR